MPEISEKMFKEEGRDSKVSITVGEMVLFESRKGEPIAIITITAGERFDGIVRTIVFEPGR